VSTRISILVVAVCAIILGCLTGVGSAGAATPPPSACTVFVFDVNLGQGVEAYCDNAPGTYQVVALCSDDLDLWSIPGSLASAAAGPSLAECRGPLLFPAHVVNYFVAQ
jgi:hypothetical protein